MNNPLISIIIPVYNAEKYLRQCLDSVIAQSYANWEGLLIDDGSTDGSGRICDEYSVADTRFRVIHKENGGVSSARNVGINEAKGDWIYFSDSDDTLFEDCIETLYTGVSKNNVNIAQAGFIRYDVDGSIIEKCDELFNTVYDNEVAIIQTYHSKYYTYQGYLWNKLFRRDLIVKYQLRFCEDIYYDEDSLFVVQYLVRTQCKMFFTTKPVYKYYLRDSGAMMALKVSFNRKLLTNQTAYNLKYFEIRNSQQYSQKTIELAKRCCYNTYGYILNIMKSCGFNDKSTEKELKNMLLDVYTIDEYNTLLRIESIKHIYYGLRHKVKVFVMKKIRK